MCIVTLGCVTKPLQINAFLCLGLSQAVLLVSAGVSFVLARKPCFWM